MSARLLIPAALRSSADGQREVAVVGGTLRSVLDDLAVRMPVLERRIRVLRPHVLVFVDGVMVRAAEDLDTPVRDGTEVMIAPAVSGG
jgi:sulfur-carrier protein